MKSMATLSPRPLGARQNLAQMLPEEGAVSQPSKRIVMREVVGLGLRPLPRNHFNSQLFIGLSEFGRALCNVAFEIFLFASSSDSFARFNASWVFVLASTTTKSMGFVT